MGKDRKSKEGDADAAAEKIELPPAKSIFKVHAPPPASGANAGPEEDAKTKSYARAGELLSGTETPCFTVFTSRGMPFYLRPEVMASVMGNQKQLWQVPIGDAFMRTDSVKQSPDASKGCRGFWPHLENQVAYCSFRNVRLNPSIHGGDAVCSVETTGGRRKVGPKEWLDIQRTMRMDLVAAPAEDVPMDVAGARRVNRAVSRAGDWLKEILEAKATDESLAFDWHVLATVQGCGDVKVRQKACAAAAAMPVAGIVVGGLGYDETLASRGRVLQVVAEALPDSLPRFLPLGKGSPIEVLQGVLAGIDVFELTYPVELAWNGIALTFSSDMPAEDSQGGAIDEELLAVLLPEAKPAEAAEAPAEANPVEAAVTPAEAKPTEAAEAPAEAGAVAPAIPVSTSATAAAPAPALPESVKQMYMQHPDCREDFGPISEDSPVRQYSRAYLYHLMEVRELLGTMLLTQHNLDAYVRLFGAIRRHIKQGTIRQFATWFLKTQTCATPVNPVQGPAAKRRKQM